MAKTPAWQRKAGKNPKGGLNARGRASYKKGTLKPPVKSGDNPRRASFLARMGGNEGTGKGFKGKTDTTPSQSKSLGSVKQSRRKTQGGGNKPKKQSKET